MFACRIEFYDEISKVESSVDSAEEQSQAEDTPPVPADFAVKVLQLSNVRLELGSCLSSVAMEGEGPWLG